MGDYFTYIVIYVCCGTTRCSSTHHGDDTIGAEVVAAIVNFDEAAGMEGVEGRLVAEQVAVVALGVAVPCAEMLVDDIE